MFWLTILQNPRRVNPIICRLICHSKVYANSYTCFALQLCVWVAGTTWGLSFAYYTCMVLPYKAFDYRYPTPVLGYITMPNKTTMTICFNCSNDGLAGCAPVPQTGVLMLVSTCLLYFPTTMTLLYVYGTVFHSHNSSQRLVPTTTRTLPAAAAGQSLVKTATRYECNDHCTEGYCNVTLFFHVRHVLIRIHNEMNFFIFLGWVNKKGQGGRGGDSVRRHHVFGVHYQLYAVDH